MNILFLEDNVEFANIICELLDNQGYSVSCFDNVIDALDAFETQLFDLIISDLHLKVKIPGTTGSGLDFIRRVRKTSKVPIIVTTGLELISEESLQDREVNYFVHKGADFDFPKFIDKIKELCPT